MTIRNRLSLPLTASVDPPRVMTTSGGLLFVDKPAGLTSHDVVARVRRAARTRRVGHAGTLDPFATGLLVLAIGTATRPDLASASCVLGEACPRYARI